MTRLTEPGAIGSPGGTHPIAIDGDTVHFAWAQGGRIYYRRSADGGKTWGDLAALTEHNTAQYPCSLERSGQALHLIWPDSRDGKWEIYYKRSQDGGRTWGGETRLTPGVDLFRLGTAISGSNIHLVWGSRGAVVPTPAGTHTWGELHYIRSTDNGDTWEPVMRLTQPRNSAMCPAIAASGEMVHVTWFDNRDSKQEWDWEVYYKRSTDGGKTWGRDVRMTDTPTHTRHPQILATGRSRVCCVWEDGQVFDGKRWSGDAALYAAISEDSGQTWKPAKRITAVDAPHSWGTHSKSYLCGSRIHLAWTDAPDGRDHAMAAYYMTSPDGGLTWSAPQRLTTAQDGECWAQSVAGTDKYAITVISRADTLQYRRCDLSITLERTLVLAAR